MSERVRWKVMGHKTWDVRHVSLSQPERAGVRENVTLYLGGDHGFRQFLPHPLPLGEGIFPRTASATLLNKLEHDPTVEIESVTESLYQKAFRLFQERQDKEWGMADCISSVVMKERGLVEALTADEHFEQAGFRALLKE